MQPISDNERYARQIMLPEIGEEGQRKLAQSRVLIVGVGGLGSPISLYLTGAGVGTIGLVDADVVSLSNLQRQVLYTEPETGLPKTEQAAHRLHALNSGTHINTYPFRLEADNAARLIADYDIVVDGCDNFATRYLIDDTCRALGKPYVYGTICGLDGMVSVFHYQGSPYGYRTLYPDEAGMLSMAPPSKGVVGVTPAIVGATEANEVLKIICGYGKVLSGTLWTIDLRTMQTHLLQLCE